MRKLPLPLARPKRRTASSLLLAASLASLLSLTGCAFGLIGIGVSSVQLWVDRDKYFGPCAYQDKKSAKPKSSEKDACASKQAAEKKQKTETASAKPVAEKNTQAKAP